MNLAKVNCDISEGSSEQCGKCFLEITVGHPSRQIMLRPKTLYSCNETHHCRVKDLQRLLDR